MRRRDCQSKINDWMVCALSAPSAYANRSMRIDVVRVVAFVWFTPSPPHREWETSVDFIECNTCLQFWFLLNLLFTRYIVSTRVQTAKCNGTSKAMTQNVWMRSCLVCVCVCVRALVSRSRWYHRWCVWFYRLIESFNRLFLTLERTAACDRAYFLLRTQHELRT